MSYLNSLQKYRDMMEFGRGELPESVSSLTQLPPDQSQNIFNYTQGKEQAEIGMQAAAPFAAIAGADLLRRGAQAFPAIQKIRDAFNQGGEFADKMKGLLGDENVANFLNDPQGTLGKLAESQKGNILQALAEKFGNQAEQIGNQASTLGDQVANIGRSLPTAEDLGGIAGRFAQAFTGSATQGLAGALPTSEDVAGAIGQGITSSIFGAPKPPTQEDLDFDRAFQEDLDRGPITSDHPPQAGQVEAEAPRGELDPTDDALEDEEFLEADSRPDFNVRSFGYDEGDDEGGFADPDPMPKAPSTGTNIKVKTFGDEPEEGLMDEPKPGLPAEPEAPVETPAEDLSAKIGAQKVESGALESAIQKGASGSADFGADGLAKTLAKVGGDEAPELSTGLGVGDFIPGLGLAFDVASIGSIIGAAVDYYSNKSKEEKAEEEESQREDAIQQDIAQEQNELVGEGRNASVVQATQNQQQQQSSLPLPISQSGTD